MAKTWIGIVLETATLLTVNNRPVLIGDNIKVAKKLKECPELKNCTKTPRTNLAAKIVLHIGKPSFLVLDAYFSTKVAFVAFTQPPEVTVKRRGRPRKYGEQIRFKEIFAAWAERFNKAVLYGKKETIQYLCLDLLWKPLAVLSGLCW